MLKLADNRLSDRLTLQLSPGIMGHWRVAHTRARFEKAFAWDLLRPKTLYLSPMISKATIWKGRKRSSLVPLFPSYVFFCGGADCTSAGAGHESRFRQVIPVRDRKQFVRELAAIEKALDHGTSIEFYPFAAVGKRCRIASGPLQGLEGTVVQVRGVARLVLHVSILGRVLPGDKRRCP